jgi:tRNA pseudouridine13 synthase
MWWGDRKEKGIMDQSVPIYLFGQLGLASFDLPGIGGVIKQLPEDFVVEELPAYEPDGAGDHLFVTIRKRELTTRELVDRIRRCCMLSDDAIGVAGLKDAHAVTTQVISIPLEAESHLHGIEDDKVQILAAKPHSNKLRTGHLAGNRFTIKIRDARSDGGDMLTAIIERIKMRGMLNFYDTQRFGQEGKTGRDGMKLLTLGRDSKKFREKWQAKLQLSAAQSLMFNDYLAERTQRWGDTLFLGDMMAKCDTGGVFWLDDLEFDRSRFVKGEIVPTGPIFGKKMRSPRGEMELFERQILERHGVTLEMFAAFGKMVLGTRRENIVRPKNLVAGYTAPTEAELSFELPSGSYATVLLAEIMKPLSGPC